MQNIKELSHNDYEDWKHIFNEYLLFYDAVLPLSTIKSSWDKIINKEEPIYCVGFYKSLKKSKKLIGIINFIYHQSTWSKKNVCYLEDLFVLEPFRSKGIASALFGHLINICKTKNIDKLYWKTKSDNFIAQSLYNKLALKTDFIEYEINLEK